MRIRFVSAVLLALAWSGSASAEPPIESPQDAACRDEARGKVFGAPNPGGLTLYDLGSQLYHECMRRSGGPRSTGSLGRPANRPRP